jgi:hypothetical protein
MRRRDLMAGFGAAMATWPAVAQSPDRARIGLLSLHRSEIEKGAGANAFRAGMQSLGHREGRPSNFTSVMPRATRLGFRPSRLSSWPSGSTSW